MSSKDEDMTKAELKKKNDWVKKEADEKAKADADAKAEEQFRQKAKEDAAKAKAIEDELAEAEKEQGQKVESEDLKDPEDKDAKDDKNIKDDEKRKYIVDMSFKKEEESMEEFLKRAEQENLGHWSNDEGEKEGLKGGNIIIGEGIIPRNVDNSGKIKSIRKTRVKIDKFSKLLEGGFATNESLLSEVFFGKAWLGKLLSEFSSENPYANEASIKSRKDIPATADEYTVDNYYSEIYQFNLKNNEFKIIELRKMLQKLIDNINGISFTNEEVQDMRLASIAKTNSYTHLVQAKFILGKELSKLRIS